jgi:hypothetical protein
MPARLPALRDHDVDAGSFERLRLGHGRRCPTIVAPADFTSAKFGIPKVKLNRGTRSSTTTASCSCSAGCASGASGFGQSKRLTMKGASVSSRTDLIAARKSAGASHAAPSAPSAPAFETAATSSDVVMPDIGACTSG